MTELRLIALLQKHAVLIPLIPTILGSCFIVGYLSPLGPAAIQSISYVDILNFTLIFFVYISIIILGVIIIYQIATKVKRTFGDRAETIFLIGSTVTIGILLAIASALSEIYPGRLSEIGLNLLLILAVCPMIIAGLRIKKFINRPVILFGIAGPIISLFSGVISGEYDYKYLPLDDSICTTNCETVGVFAVLSEYVMALDCDRSILFIRSAEIKKIKVTHPRTVFEILSTPSECSLAP